MTVSYEKPKGGGGCFGGCASALLGSSFALFGVIAIVLGSVLGQRILDPVHRLIDASKKVSSGDLSPDIGSISQSEIGGLQRTFAEMLESLRDRDQRQRAESERKLLQSEKQASIGRLAAGVAHEINNPLTGVVTFTHMVLRRPNLPDESSRNQPNGSERSSGASSTLRGR